MIKTNLIIPMAGVGKRFIDANYITNKSLLKVNKFNTVLEKIFQNFNKKNTDIYLIISNKKFASKVKSLFKDYNIKIITINKHKKGPLNSIYLARNALFECLQFESNIFISYSDINWKWDFEKVLNYIKKKDSVVFSHKGYHPHLEVNSNCDFLMNRKNLIIKLKKKKVIGNDYKKNLLAVGCYYFKKFSQIDDYLDNFRFNSVKEEYYLIDLLKIYLKEKIKIYHYNIKKFVHLGTPEQYEDYLNWYNFFLKEKINKKIKNNYLLDNSSVVMLAGGKGSRIKDISSNKILIKLNRLFLYKKIFQKFNVKNKILVINNNNLKKYINHRNLRFIKISKTKSMLETLLKIKNKLINYNNFFLTSCDCIPYFKENDFKKIYNKKNIDLIFFGFKFTNLQKSLSNSHSLLLTKKNNVFDIKVKNKYISNTKGHAGYFWIRDGSIFNFLDLFVKTSQFKSLKREVIIDDFFKYLINKRLINSSYVDTEYYIHLGSSQEFNEYRYWNKYFGNR